MMKDFNGADEDDVMDKVFERHRVEEKNPLGAVTGIWKLPKYSGATKERPRIEGYDMDAQTAKTADENKEASSFAAYVPRLMDIIIDTLYTKKEVFIRE